jgi:hypothetical protein
MEMKTVTVRYRTKPECADENEAMVRRVFDALAQSGPPDVHYRVMREADGNTFVHLSTRPAAAEGNPLRQVEAFREFVSGIKDRCEDPPKDMVMRFLGEYQG